MEQKYLGRLNQLFEKMVANSVSASEKNELEALYGRFIEEGRSDRDRISSHYRARKASPINH